MAITPGGGSSPRSGDLDSLLGGGAMVSLTTGYGPRNIGLSQLMAAMMANNKAKTPADYGPAPSGTGLGFLTGINYGSTGLTQEQMAADPFGGGWKNNYTPAFLAQFLKGEMGPGGYLGAASQTRATALGMGQIVRGGEADIAAQQRSMAAAGVAAPSLTAMRSANQSVMADRARSYLTQRRSEQDEMRFDAMKGFVDMLSQTVASQKSLEANYEAAKAGASATRSAGRSGMFGAIVGGALSALL